MFKTIILGFLIGLTAFILVSICFVLLNPYTTFYPIFDQQLFLEVYIFMFLLFFFLLMHISNKKIKFVFESIILFSAAYIFILGLSIIFGVNAMVDSHVLIISSVILFIIWLLYKKEYIKRFGKLYYTLIIIAVIIFLDILNMFWFYPSLKTISDAEFRDGIDELDIHKLHYSIYSEKDTLNMTQSGIETVKIPLPKKFNDSLKNYDDCRINTIIKFRPYLAFSQAKYTKDFREYSWFEKFYTEFMITFYNDGNHYLRNRKTGEFIKRDDLWDKIHDIKK